LSKPRQSATGSALVYLVAIFLFMVAVLSINVGLNMYFAPTPDVTGSLVYLSVGVISIGLVGMTILRVRRGSSMAGIPPKVLSVVRCSQCTFKQIKSFAMGDYVFKAEGRCAQCGNESLFINGIYAEDLRRRPNMLTG
jgi:hypothetical protein